MKSQLAVISLAALFFLTTGCKEPIDSEGHLYEFRCEKRPECNNQYGLVQIAYGIIYGADNSRKPDLSKTEVIVFCCDQLAQSIDSLKKYRELMGPFNDSLKGRVLSREEFDGADDSLRKFVRAFYFGEDTICIDLRPEFIVSTRTFKTMLITIGHKSTGKIWLMFTGREELDLYIEFLEDNYKRCCI